MLNLKSICGDNHIGYIESGHHHCHEGWAQIHCPFCSDGSRGFHLGFNLNFGNFHCWRCGVHKPRDVLVKLLGTSNPDILRKAYKKYTITSRHAKPEPKTRKRNIKLPSHTSNLASVHIKYLERRGFNPKELIKEWGIKATKHLSGQWNWRIIIPIFDIDGNMVAYQGRTIHEEVRPKYKMCDDEDCLMEPKSLIYGLNKVKTDSIIIVEGVTGVWRIGHGSIGLFGIDWNKCQAAILRQFKNRFILFDPEPEAKKRAEELAEWLSYFDGNTEIIEGYDHDSGELTKEEVKELRILL